VLDLATLRRYRLAKKFGRYSFKFDGEGKQKKEGVTDGLSKDEAGVE
jgi:hypothetical protein